MRYGVPYQGSKNKLVKHIIPFLPSAPHFHDVFAGGCAVTHAALLSGKYDTVHANDICDAPQLFMDAVNGKYADEKRWISREDFFRMKDTDPYVRLCWSFGNNAREYLYCREIEPYKKALHYAVVFDDFSLLHVLCPEVSDTCENTLQGMKDTKQRRIEIGRAVVRWLKEYGTWEMVEANPLYRSCHRKKRSTLPLLQRLQSLQRLESLESLERLESLQRLESLESLQRLERLQSLESLERLESLQRLESLESLQSLQRLQSLERLEVTQKDYRELTFETGSVIYCDIPYKGKKGYSTNFDHDAFCQWALAQENLVVVSEYAMPEDFLCIAEIKHQCKYCSYSNKQVTERLFIPKRQKGMYEDMMQNDTSR